MANSAKLRQADLSQRLTGMKVFVSPHYYYPTDHGWKFGGAGEVLMHTIKMFDGRIRSAWKGSKGPEPTGWTDTSRTSRTATPS